LVFYDKIISMIGLSRILDKPWVVWIILCIVAFLAYGHILHAPFQFDDLGILIGNPNIESIPHFFKTWQKLERKALTFLTFALNYQIGKHDPFGYHLVNVLLHTTTAIFLFYIILRLLSTAGWNCSILPQERRWFALCASLIFLIHPLQTQSVTYIWQRSEVLSGFFYLLSYLFYLKGRVQKKLVYYFLAALIFYIGIFAKGTIVSLPVLVVLTEFYFFGTKQSRKIIGWMSFTFVLTFFVSVLFPHPFRIFLEKFHLGFLVRNYEEMKVDYFWTQFKALMVYIRLCFLPINQNVDYYFPIVRPWPDWKVALSFLALIFIFTMAVRLYCSNRLMSFGIFWFFIYLMPTSMMYLLVDLIFEHRVYISMAGFGIFLMTFLFTSINDIRWRYSVMIVIFLSLGTLTILRNNLWRSPVALMEDTIKKSPLNPRPYLNLGTYYYRQGELDKAAIYYEKAIALKPFYIELYNNLGLIYRDKGERDRARTMFEKTISTNDKFVLGYLNLAYTYMDEGNLSKAEELLERALSIEKSDKVYTALGFLHFSKRDYGQAQDYFFQAMEFNPNNPKAFYGAGNVFFARRYYKDAIQMYQKTLTIEPNFAQAYENMMRVYYEMGDFENYRKLSDGLRRETLKRQTLQESS